MNSRYPLVQMGQFLRLRKEFFTIDDAATYRLVTVQLHARGIRERQQLTGAEIKTKRQQRIRAGDLLVAEIDAKVGGFGIVPAELEGAIVSSHYFLYEIDASQVDPRYLEYYLKSGQPEQDVQQFVKGSVNYAAIRPYHFPQLHIPLPPLDEQRRIVARIDALAGRIAEANRLQSEIEANLQGLLLGAYRRIIEAAPLMAMRDVAPLIRRPVEVDPEKVYLELGIRSFGKGTFHKPPISGTALGEKRVYRIEPGDLLFSNVFAWEGAVAVARPEDSGRIGSHRFITCLPNSELALAQFLCFHFLTEQGLAQLAAASPGAAGRNRTLGLKTLEKLQVPIPPLAAQRWFVAIKARVDTLRDLQNRSNAEMDDLFSAVLDKAFRGEL